MHTKKIKDIEEQRVLLVNSTEFTIIATYNLRTFQLVWCSVGNINVEHIVVNESYTSYNSLERKRVYVLPSSVFFFLMNAAGIRLKVQELLHAEPVSSKIPVLYRSYSAYSITGFWPVRLIRSPLLVPTCTRILKLRCYAA